MSVIAVIGPGAIGGLVAGYLKARGEDVIAVGRPDIVRAIKQKGLKISGVRGDFNVKLDIVPRLNLTPHLVILATKTQDIEAALEQNRPFIQNTTILTTQNGIQADSIVKKYFPEENIVSSIVMFGATYLEPGNVVHNFEGGWIIGKMFGAACGDKLSKLSQVLDRVFPVTISEDILGMKYLKIFINANNCIPAILGLSIQAAFADLEISKIGVAIWREGLKVITRAGIKMVSLPDFPSENIQKLTALSSAQAAEVLSGIMTKLSATPVYGSVLQSIKRNRKSEIDYINGEFLRIAEENRLSAPLNKKLIEMVHEVERTKRFFTKEDLLNGARMFLD